MTFIASVPQLWWHNLPPIEAALNGLSAVFLLTAFVMIKRRWITAHATLMIAAVVTSAAFLACYLLYHVLKKINNDTLVTVFPAGPWRPWYLALLLSHTGLAFVILPLIAASLWLAWKRNWKLHHKVSSVTFPLWFYVSVTGVMVYWILYKVVPTMGH